MKERKFFRIWYWDTRGRWSEVRGNSMADWVSQPDDNVLLVTEVFEASDSKKQRYVYQHYSADYYWIDNEGQIGAGFAKQIPAVCYVKSGVEIDRNVWVPFYNMALEQLPYGS